MALIVFLWTESFYLTTNRKLIQQKQETSTPPSIRALVKDSGFYFILILT